MRERERMLRVELALNLLRLRLQLPGHDRWSRSALMAHQERSLRLLRQYAYTYSPFYAKFHKGLFDRPLHELPVLRKSTMMDAFDDLVTDRSIRLADVEAHLPALQGDQHFMGRYWVNATSGSTGKRGFFLFNAREWAFIIAGFGRANLWAGFENKLLSRKKIATIASRAPWHMSFRIMATLENRWIPMLRIDAREPVGRLVEVLNGWRPQMLAAYPSSLRALAKEQLAGRLRIAPERIYTGGEVLSAEIRRLAFTAWGTQIFDQFGTTETGNLAAECSRHSGLHINEDLLILEAVDSANRPVPAGAYGDKLLVTVLFNRTQPLIRYELSDRAKLAASPCACGKPYRLIESIEGRAEEMLEFPAELGGSVAIHPLVFEQLLDAVPAAEWQVVQEPGRLLVLLAGAKDDFRDEGLIQSLRQELAAHGAKVPIIEVSRVSSIPRGVTGKAPIIRKHG